MEDQKNVQPEVQPTPTERAASDNVPEGDSVPVEEAPAEEAPAPAPEGEGAPAPAEEKAEEDEE